LAYFILARLLTAHHGPESALARALGRDWKGKASVLMYAAAVPLAFVDPRISGAVYVAVAVMWLVPDRRIETTLSEKPE
jgi:hypothetical protein